MQRAYVRANKAATFYFYLTGPQGSYGTAGAATGQESSLTAYYVIDGGSYTSTGTTVEEVDGSTLAGIYKVTCTDVVTDGYNIVMNLYHSSGSTYRSDPLAISTDTLYPPGMNIIAIHEGTTAAANLELAFDGTGYIGGSTLQSVNATQISGDSAAANNLESAFDGTGYAGGTIKQEVDINKVSGDATAATNLEAAFDGTGYAGGTIKQEVDINKVSGDATAATNLEAAFDGTGYAGGTIKQEADIAKIDGSTDGVSSLGKGADSMLEGSCTTGSTTSSIKGTGSLSTVDDFYNDRMLLFTGGSGGLQYQGRAITDYDGSSKTFTTDAFTSAPATGDTFLIV